jgi:hypothetical protein
MNKRAFISSLPCLGLSGLVLAEKGKAMPELTPEACSMQSPESMWQQQLATDTPSSSEQAQTRFYQSYEVSLRQWTDWRFPDAKALRPHVMKAFTSAMDFIVLDVWGAVAHVLTRLPAEIEWCICNGFNHNFEGAYVGRYNHKIVSDLLAAIFEANAEPYKKLADSHWRITDCLAALTDAEKLLPMQGAFYFRSQLLKRVGQCI